MTKKTTKVQELLLQYRQAGRVLDEVFGRWQVAYHREQAAEQTLNAAIDSGNEKKMQAAAKEYRDASAALAQIDTGPARAELARVKSVLFDALGAK